MTEPAMTEPAMTEPTVRQLTRNEVDMAVEWAALEGWNPGLHDAEAFWAQDSDGFWGAELDGELVGCASAISYDGAYGFWGFFIVKPEFRGRRIGSLIANTTISALRERLAPGAAVGLGGVFDQQAYYASLGFTYSHRNLRMEAIAQPVGEPEHDLVPLSSVPVDSLARFDTEHFGVARPRFLEKWVSPADGLALAAIDGNEVLGAGVIRRAQSGWKVAPLFAHSAEVAESLLNALSAHAAGDPMSVDVPEINSAAMEMADRREMRQVFGCARMYYGTPPDMPWDSIFGITSYELG